jgi:hypothetical protein
MFRVLIITIPLKYKVMFRVLITTIPLKYKVMFRVLITTIPLYRDASSVQLFQPIVKLQ